MTEDRRIIVKVHVPLNKLLLKAYTVCVHIYILFIKRATIYAKKWHSFKLQKYVFKNELWNWSVRFSFTTHSWRHTALCFTMVSIFSIDLALLCRLSNKCDTISDSQEIMRGDNGCRIKSLLPISDLHFNHVTKVKT